MKCTKFLIYIFIICSLGASAQLMNVRKWRQSERDSLDKGLEMFDEKMYLRALPIFENLLAQHPKEEFLKYSLAKCALYRSDKHEEAYKYFVEVYNNNKKVPDIQYDMALAALYNYKFDEATDYINQYAENRHTAPEGKKAAEILKRNIGYAKYYLANPTSAKVTNVGSAINSEYDEYVPAITADESALIFTYAGPKSLGGRLNENLVADKYGNYLEDIYVSYKINGVFQPAVALDSLNTTAPDAAISLSEDGTILFIYQDIGDGHGDIYQSVLQGEHFSKPQKLRGEVNSYSWDGHCSISPDGHTLYFSSERAGGLGGRDLYKATLLLPDSVWGNVVNLGDSINTPYDDDAPFIHADGITLYYSSKGRSSMGGYDIFRSVMRTEDSTFKKTDNLGYPINSSSDDIYFVMGASGNSGYYSSGKKDGMGMKDIYHVEPNFNWPKPALYLVKGKVKNGSEGIEAAIKVEITSKNNKLYKTIKSNSKTGEYLVSLPPGVAYQLTYSYKNLPDQRLSINAVDLSGYMEKINDVNFEEKADILAANTAKLPSEKGELELKKAAETQTLNAAKNAEKIPGEAEVNQEPLATNLAVAKNSEKPVATPKQASVAPTPEPTEEVINHIAPKPVTSTASTSSVTAVTPKEEPVTKTSEPIAAVEKKNPVKEPITETPVTSVKKEPATEKPVVEKKENPPSVAEPVVTKTPAAKTRTTTAVVDFTATPVTSTPLILPVKTRTTTAVVDFTSTPVTSTPLNLPPPEPVKIPSRITGDEFVPVNGPQAKAVKFTQKYGEATANDMEFRVQVAAVKNDKNVELANQKRLGKVEKLNLNDGFIRITVGGAFKTLADALEHNKKVVKAGQKEGFIIALYQGKRMSLDELEKMGLLK